MLGLGAELVGNILELRAVIYLWLDWPCLNDPKPMFYRGKARR
jgi:hypothetical protein